MRVCQSCQREEEESFEKVSAYVREHPGIPLNAVAAELELSFEILMKYVREGRLQVRGADGTSINYCEKCGKVLTTQDAHEGGRFCRACEGGLSAALESTRKDLAEKLAANTNHSAFLMNSKRSHS